MGFIALFIGVAVLVFGLTQHLKGKRILAAPFKKTGELVKDPTSSDPKGAMSTEGAVSAVQPLLSPCTKTPCLAFEVEITREWEKQEQTQEGVKTKSGSTKAEGLKQGMTFQLDDGTGAFPVDCTKADVSDFDTTKNGYNDKVKIGAFVPGELVFGELRMQTPSLPSGERTTAFRAVEKLVPVGGTLFVLGKLENGALGKPGWRSMMFSSKGRDGLLASTAKKKKFSFIGGGVAAVASIPLMIFGPSAPPSTACKSELTGNVAHCTDNLTSSFGETYTWKVEKAGTYQVAVIPPAGKKFGLDPDLTITDSKFEEVLGETAENRGERASGSARFEAGTYKIKVKDVDGQTVKGGFDYALEITGGPASAAPAAVAKAGASKAGSAAKVDDAPAANVDEKVADAPAAEEANAPSAGPADSATPYADEPASEMAFASMDAPMFLAEYLKGKPAADARFAGKVVVLKGLVSSIDKDVDDRQYVVFNPGLKFSVQGFFPGATASQAQALKVDRLALLKCRVRPQGSNLDLDDANILLDGCSVEVAKGKVVAMNKTGAKKGPAGKQK